MREDGQPSNVPRGGGDLLSIIPVCVCSKVKEMGFFLACSE